MCISFFFFFFFFCCLRDLSCCVSNYFFVFCTGSVEHDDDVFRSLLLLLLLLLLFICSFYYQYFLLWYYYDCRLTFSLQTQHKSNTHSHTKYVRTTANKITNPSVWTLFKLFCSVYCLDTIVLLLLLLMLLLFLLFDFLVLSVVVGSLRCVCLFFNFILFSLLISTNKQKKENIEKVLIVNFGNAWHHG